MIDGYLENMGYEKAVIESLREGARILLKSGWVKHVMAKDDSHNQVPFCKPVATKFCMQGAVARAIYDNLKEHGNDEDTASSVGFDGANRISYLFGTENAAGKEFLTMGIFNDSAVRKREVIDKLNDFADELEAKLEKGNFWG